MSKLKDSRQTEVIAVVTPVLRGFSVFKEFPATPIGNLTIATNETAMQALDIQAEAFGRACQVALRIHDALLHKQISYLHGMHGMAKALLTAETYIAEHFGPNAKYSQKNKIEVPRRMSLGAPQGAQAVPGRARTMW